RDVALAAGAYLLVLPRPAAAPPFVFTKGAEMSAPAQTPPRISEPPKPQKAAKAIKRSSIKRDRFFPYALSAPAAFLELLIHIIPMLLGVWIAFLSLTQFSIANWVKAPFIGLQNFATALDPNGPIGSQFFDA